MIAYGTGLDSASTTMVLTPDSEFMRYFKNADGTPVTAPPAPAAPANGAAASAPAQ